MTLSTDLGSRLQPVQSFNPDWAVLVERNGCERPFFVVETKSSLIRDDLRDRESGKIKCGEAHFAELMDDEDNSARLIKATKLDPLWGAK